MSKRCCLRCQRTCQLACPYVQKCQDLCCTRTDCLKCWTQCRAICQAYTLECCTCLQNFRGGCRQCPAEIRHHCAQCCINYGEAMVEARLSGPIIVTDADGKRNLSDIPQDSITCWCTPNTYYAEKKSDYIIYGSLGIALFVGSLLTLATRPLQTIGGWHHSATVALAFGISILTCLSVHTLCLCCSGIPRFFHRPFWQACVLPCCQLFSVTLLILVSVGLGTLLNFLFFHLDTKVPENDNGNDEAKVYGMLGGIGLASLFAFLLCITMTCLVWAHCKNSYRSALVGEELELVELAQELSTHLKTWPDKNLSTIVHAYYTNQKPLDSVVVL